MSDPIRVFAVDTENTRALAANARKFVHQLDAPTIKRALDRLADELDACAKEIDYLREGKHV